VLSGHFKPCTYYSGAVQLGRLTNATYPLLKRSKDDSVSFRSMKLQKFCYCCIELCSRFRSPALLTHSQPSALKRSKSAFLLVGHGPLFIYRARERCRPRAVCSKFCQRCTHKLFASGCHRMSALPPRADIVEWYSHVRFAPLSDQVRCSKNSVFRSPRRRWRAASGNGDAERPPAPKVDGAE
jgi:hypothetical protein